MGSDIRYDSDLIRRDMAALGWLAKDLADAAMIHAFTVSKFLRGTKQTPRTAKRIAAALGKTPADYLVPADSDRPTEDRRTNPDRRAHANG